MKDEKEKEVEKREEVNLYKQKNFLIKNICAVTYNGEN